MEKILKEYRNLKSKLSGEQGSEESSIEASWNDGIQSDMNSLISKFPKDVQKLIKLNHI